MRKAIPKATKAKTHGTAEPQGPADKATTATTAIAVASSAKPKPAATAKPKRTSKSKSAIPQRVAPPLPLGPNITGITVGITVGIDLGDKKHAICALDPNGEILDQRKITNHKESLRRLSQKYPTARMVMEVGSHSPWISRLLKDLGHDVLVANPRKLHAIYKNDRKSDECDAEMLARLGRVDPKLLHPIAHQGEQAQIDLLQIKLRDNLVRQRVHIISSVRFSLKSLGHPLTSPNTHCFAKQARENLTAEETARPDLLAMIGPSLLVIDTMTAQIKVLDRAIAELGKVHYPTTQLLQQITGVGPITSLAFVLTIGDPDRSASSRDIGPYLGLVPKRDQSGDIDKQLPISKAGNAHLRKLLVSAAQYILGPFGPDTDLRRSGLKLAERGGRGAKKKAVIATARKLGVLLHTLWVRQSDYIPLRPVNIKETGATDKATKGIAA
ncbi:MAG: IS110 family transposase [Verrucomicrobia bacterium]|nr:IS110 family transposase [Verrucomicrobiota bacterium]